MSTRGAIVRSKGNGKFIGVYHHWDSYPSGLGATLFRIRNGHFKGDTNAMLKVLIDEHTAWSTIVNANFAMVPAYSERGDQPKCYCHGERSDENTLITHKDASSCGCEWVYSFSKDGKFMYVLSSYRRNGHKMIGMFGLGDPKSVWSMIAKVDLNGKEPLWDEIREKGSRSKKEKREKMAHE